MTDSERQSHMLKVAAAEHVLHRGALDGCIKILESMRQLDLSLQRNKDFWKEGGPADIALANAKAIFIAAENSVINQQPKENRT